MGLPQIMGNERELYTNAFAFVEDADPEQLELFSEDVDDLGGKTFRCDKSVTRMLVVCTRQSMLDLCDGNGPLSKELRRSMSNLLDRNPHSLRLGGRTLILDRTLVMGILNVTPDSFSDGGLHDSLESALVRAHEMVDEGADIIDIGGESTRPGSDPVSERVEMARVIPVVRRVVEELDVPVSIDTRRAEVARRALEEGASMVNDVTGLREDGMVELAAETDLPFVIMHMRGEPRTMQVDIHYDDVVGDILLSLHRNLNRAVKAGVDPDNMIIDPGIGFGKTVDNNLEILRRLGEFRCVGLPILVGPSRKAFIGRILDLPAEQRIEGTLSAMVASILNGADMVRVHDVREANRASRIADEIRRS